MSGRLHEVMAGYVERGDVPGLVTLVAQRDEVDVAALGTTAFGGADPMRRDTLFRISSMTKPITAAAVMILVEDGALTLDEPVDRLLPELADRKVMKRPEGPLDDTVPAHRPITARDLLTFTWGFGLMMAAPDAYPILRAANELGLGLGPPMPSSMPAPDEWMRRLGTLPLMYRPGERWLYTTGSEVLGVLIARASGRPLETFLRERLFAPLGMRDTGFWAPADKVGRLATGYSTDWQTGKIGLYDTAVGGQWSVPPAFPSGAAGLVSTVDDYLAFGRMLLNGGRHGDGRVLSEASVGLMTSDHLTPAQKAVSGLVPHYFDAHGWGFGMAVVTGRDELGRSIGAYGWDGGLGTSWYADPREELIGVFMTQSAWTSPSPPDVCRDFWTEVYRAVGERGARTTPSTRRR